MAVYGSLNLLEMRCFRLNWQDPRFGVDRLDMALAYFVAEKMWPLQV